MYERRRTSDGRADARARVPQAGTAGRTRGDPRSSLAVHSSRTDFIRRPTGPTEPTAMEAVAVAVVRFVIDELEWRERGWTSGEHIPHPLEGVARCVAVCGTRADKGRAVADLSINAGRLECPLRFLLKNPEIVLMCLHLHYLCKVL